MRSLAATFGPIALTLGLATLGCLGTGDVLGSIDEPIPMGTPGVPGLDTQLWQSGPPVPIGTSQQFGDTQPKTASMPSTAIRTAPPTAI